MMFYKTHQLPVKNPTKVSFRLPIKLPLKASAILLDGFVSTLPIKTTSTAANLYIRIAVR